jgi:hypothetical protein
VIVRGDFEADEVAGALADAFGGELLRQLKVYDVAEIRDDEELLSTTVTIELGETTGPDDQYRGRFDDAVADAAEAMVQLDHYARGADRGSDRDKIYRLKDGLLEVLCGRDLCVGWWLNEQEYEARTCYYADDDDLEIDEDEDDSRAPVVETRRFVAFNFAICGKRYTWECPETRARFDYSGVPRLPDTRTSFDHEPQRLECTDFNLTGALDVVHYVTSLSMASKRGAA